MDRLLQFLFLFIILPSSSFAQVVEKEMDMSAGSQSGLEVDLLVDKKKAEKIWKEYVKPYGKVDWDRKNKEHILFDTNISSITSASLTVVARFNQYGDATKGSFWFKSGDNYLTSEGDAETLRDAAEFLQEYAYAAERYAVNETLKNEEKELKNLDKDLKKLIKNNGKYHKEIEKAQKKIAEKEEDIEKNLTEQEEKKKEIESQREKIQNTTIKLTQVGKTNN